MIMTLDFDSTAYWLFGSLVCLYAHLPRMEGGVFGLPTRQCSLTYLKTGERRGGIVVVVRGKWEEGIMWKF